MDINCNNDEQLKFITTINDQIAPTWYSNMTKPNIAKHPIIDRRISESQFPDIIKMDKFNELSKCYNCYQPKWNSNCS